MAIDAKKHTTIAAGEKPTRAALAAGFLSVNDVIPVANATEATQVVVALAALGQNIATTPVTVARANARGLHRIEITYDPAGLVWMPASGVSSFATKQAADDWAGANASLLSVDDQCTVSGVRYWWTGAAWDNRNSGWVPLVFANSWASYGSPFKVPAARLKDGDVKFRGAIRSGASGAANPIANLATPFRPVGGDELFTVGANTGTADLRVDTAGNVYVAAYNGGGNNAIVILSQVGYTP